MGTVYGYIGITYLTFHYLPDDFLNTGDFYYWYAILSGVALVYYLLKQLPRNRA